MKLIVSLIPDGFPTFRADVAALAGKYLPRLGLYTDLITQVAEIGPSRKIPWGGGQVDACGRTGSRFQDQIIGFAHDLRVLWNLPRGRYSGIQVRDKVFAAIPALWVARRRGIPFFYWMSFPMSERYIEVLREEGQSIGIARRMFLAFKGHVGKALIYRYVLPRCSHIFVQSDRMRADVIAYGIDPLRLTPVPMGVDLEKAPPELKPVYSSGQFESRRVIAYLGTFDRPRRLEFLLDVIKQLSFEIPNVTLLMIGGGPSPDDAERLKRHAESIGIVDRISWTGWVDSDDAWRWLTQAEVAVSLFPRGELLDSASPTKVVEYLALGLPVVANDQPDQHAVLTESGVGICVPMEIEAFRDALRRILSEPEFANSARVSGPAYVAKYRSYAKIAAAVNQVYLEHLRDAR